MQPLGKGLHAGRLRSDDRDLHSLRPLVETPPADVCLPVLRQGYPDDRDPSLVLPGVRRDLCPVLGDRQGMNRHEPLRCQLTALPLSVCKHCLNRCCRRCFGSLNPHSCLMCRWHQEEPDN